MLLSRYPYFSNYGLFIAILIILVFSTSPRQGHPVDPETLVKKALGRLNVSDVVSNAHDYVRTVKDGATVMKVESHLDYVKNSVLGMLGVNTWQRDASSTSVGPSLSSLISVMQLGKVAYEFEHSMFAAASCTFCKAGFMFMQYYLDSGVSVEEAKEDAKLICHGVHLVSKPVCRGLVDAFAFDVVHVLRSSDQSAEEMCGFMFGEGCGNPTIPQHDWKLNLPPTAKLLNPHVANIESRPLTVLHLSDTHWDPEYLEGSMADCGDPLCCRKESGVALLESQKAGRWGDLRKCDTPLRTIEAMYKHIAAHHTVDLIYWTGDLPPHDIWNQSRDGNVEVVRGTARQLRDHFPGVTVLPALGNHESVPVDSFPQPSVTGDPGMSWLYTTLVEEWGEWLGGGHNWTIKHGAYYSVSPSPGLRVISLNMNYCMNKNLWLLLDSKDPADELLWLIFELQLAELKGEKVHILGHIPPGHVDCVRVWSANFNAIVGRYSHIIAGQFYGHTHLDEFQLFFSKEKNQKESTVMQANNVAYIAPSVTPYHGGNPAYRLYKVGREGNIEDHATYVMDLAEANKRPNETPVWRYLYSAKEAYQLESLEPGAWANLVEQLQTNSSIFERFYFFYHSASPVRPHCDLACRHKIICQAVSARSHSTEETCKDVRVRRDAGDSWFDSISDIFSFL